MSLEFSHSDIKKIRKSLGLTQKEMGAILGMSNVNIHYIESGAQKMSQLFVDRLQSELSINNQRANELIQRYDEMNELTSYKDRALFRLNK